jgi:hypothetical protein
MSTLLDHGYGSDNNVEGHVNGVRSCEVYMKLPH